jgi:hypothetical protein
VQLIRDHDRAGCQRQRLLPDRPDVRGQRAAHHHQQPDGVNLRTSPNDRPSPAPWQMPLMTRRMPTISLPPRGNGKDLGATIPIVTAPRATVPNRSFPHHQLHLRLDHERSPQLHHSIHQRPDLILTVTALDRTGIPPSAPTTSSQVCRTRDNNAQLTSACVQHEPLHRARRPRIVDLSVQTNDAAAHDQRRLTSSVIAVYPSNGAVTRSYLFDTGTGVPVPHAGRGRNSRSLGAPHGHRHLEGGQQHGHDSCLYTINEDSTPPAVSTVAMTSNNRNPATRSRGHGDAHIRASDPLSSLGGLPVLIGGRSRFGVGPARPSAPPAFWRATP